MTITDSTTSVTFGNIAKKTDVFKPHIRSTVLNTTEGTISISYDGCKNPYHENFILVRFADVTSPAEANVSDLYDIIIGYINDRRN